MTAELSGVIVEVLTVRLAASITVAVQYAYRCYVAAGFHGRSSRKAALI